MAGPIIAGEHPRVQAVFTIVVIAFFCFLMAHDVFMTRFGWLRAIANWGSPFFRSLKMIEAGIRSLEVLVASLAA